ncbi:MAG: ABC transporter permease [marine benthic group bacterium]|jgi:ABC-2 type transport system permease protein|nr:ABC transporter permease [Gemmatimonadota bacterium]MCL7936949.1 ABC transporter permease [Gemmatimonadota bacterium]MCL7957883.1 ABC transporter permease [Gemmatimonadota bacterium]MCL7973291.1 ABC transporter permease [Gemmatimonadota bacterium]MCL7977022.1 ABC transporter permease [Gemmatimonadota bacterium]
MRDIIVVAGKELREIVGAGGGRKGLVRELLFIGIFGLLFPLTQVEAWLSGGVPAAFALMVPLFLVGPHVADSFAGERERGTLETLLATRLPDRSIYFGKILAVCGYAWAVTLLIILASLLALNFGADVSGRGGSPTAGNGESEFFVYPAFVWVAWGVGSIASGLLLASIGTFVSLRSKTVRGAHQAMMIPLFVVILGGSFGIPALFRSLPPSTQERFTELLESMPAVSVVLWAVGGLFVIDLVLLGLGARLFRRDRLISD